MNRSDVRPTLETSLYRPVKVFLEGLGFVVKGEVGGCDLVALKGDDLPVVVICELKADLQSRAHLARGRPGDH
jgi:hypothetical protein